jgi:hypothetical protein
VRNAKKVYSFRVGEPLRLASLHLPGDTFFLFTSPKTYVTLTLSEDRRLFDKDGHEYACEDETLMVDTTSRTGVWPFVLPQGHWSEAGSKPHDFVTSCLVYQLTNPRSRAEEELHERLMAVSDTLGRQIFGAVLSGLSSPLSWAFWDVKETRWK